MVDFTAANASTRMFYEIGAAVVLALFFYAALEVADLPPAGLLLIVFIFARLLPRFSMIQQTVQRIRNSLPSFTAAMAMERRFERAAEAPSAASPQPLPLDQEIRLCNVGFRYDGENDQWALRNLDLTIPARRVTALAGPSGAGKSTAADLILGLISPEEGEILIDGRPLSGDLGGRWRRSAGYVPQDPFLFHDTLRANLSCAAPDATESDLWDALKQAAAAGFVRALPEGLDTVVGDRGARLSGGERQRIALARALLRRPAFLLLDEATSSLDAESQARIEEAIQRLHGRMTILVIAHRLSSLRGADRVAVLDKGRIVEAGEWDDIVGRDGGRFQAVFQMAARREKN
jgi:ATP-binding cassette subfamily C protein